MITGSEWVSLQPQFHEQNQTIVWGSMLIMLVYCRSQLLRYHSGISTNLIVLLVFQFKVEQSLWFIVQEVREWLVCINLIHLPASSKSLLWRHDHCWGYRLSTSISRVVVIAGKLVARAYRQFGWRLCSINKSIVHIQSTSICKVTLFIFQISNFFA